jgi:hypothetical protein
MLSVLSLLDVGVAIGDGGVAGGSRYGDDLETISTRGESLLSVQKFLTLHMSPKEVRFKNFVQNNKKTLSPCRKLSDSRRESSPRLYSVISTIMSTNFLTNRIFMSSMSRSAETPQRCPNMTCCLTT